MTATPSQPPHESDAEFLQRMSLADADILGTKDYRRLVDLARSAAQAQEQLREMQAKAQDLVTSLDRADCTTSDLEDQLREAQARIAEFEKAQEAGKDNYKLFAKRLDETVDQLRAANERIGVLEAAVGAAKQVFDHIDEFGNPVDGQTYDAAWTAIRAALSTPAKKD